jgi:hypothetical protein
LIKMMLESRRDDESLEISHYGLIDWVFQVQKFHARKRDVSELMVGKTMVELQFAMRSVVKLESHLCR